MFRLIPKGWPGDCPGRDEAQAKLVASWPECPLLTGKVRDEAGKFGGPTGWPRP